MQQFTLSARGDLGTADASCISSSSSSSSSISSSASSSNIGGGSAAAAALECGWWRGAFARVVDAPGGCAASDQALLVALYSHASVAHGMTLLLDLSICLQTRLALKRRSLPPA